MDKLSLDFLCIGAAKAGTTTLHHALAQHPQIYLPSVKETCFFSSDRDYSLGYHWYLDTYFPGEKKDKIWGEITPSYLYHAQKVSKRLKAQKMDHVKIIAVFRDPVQRAYSHYWMVVNNGKESLTFQDALEQEEKRIRENEEWLDGAGRTRYTYFQSGLYAKKIRHFLDEFPEERFHFILFDDLVADFERMMLRLQKFIGVKTLVPNYEHRNQAKRYKSLLLRLFQSSSPKVKNMARNHMSFDLIKRYKKYLEGRGKEKFKYPPIDSTVEQRLREMYAQDVETLSKLIKRDLSAWLPQ
jgi:hypothetical protein